MINFRDKGGYILNELETDDMARMQRIAEAVNAAIDYQDKLAGNAVIQNRTLRSDRM